VIGHQLKKICKQKSIPFRCVYHDPTRSAAETQAVLPEDCLVQKTITCRLTSKGSEKLILWTGVADYRISRSMYKQVAKLLDMNRIQRQTSNPKDIEPLVFFSMPEGTISPFLVNPSPAVDKLDAIIFLPWPKDWNVKYEVAISLSLEESFIIPLFRLQELLLAYQTSIYPNLQVIQFCGSPNYGEEYIKTATKGRLLF